MTVTFRPATRENVPLLLGLAGGTGSGKTYSAMELARGINDGQRFAVVDTENGRASHYADQFDFDVVDLKAPFSPLAYAEAITAADAAGYGVIVVDSMSHEWEGVGGILDMQEAEFAGMGGREAVKMASWIKPKGEHRKMLNQLLQIRAHVLLCFRAQEKVEMKRDADGKMQVVPKETLTGLDGWVPISERNLPFELTLSLLLTASKPGIPKPIKLPEQLRGLVPLDKPLGHDVGVKLAEWARGGAKPATTKAAKTEIAELEEELVAIADGLGKRAETEDAIERRRRDQATFPDWLRRQVERAREGAAAA